MAKADEPASRGPEVYNNEQARRIGAIRLADFDIHEELGRGSMGPVFRATRKDDPRPYVVKVLENVEESARRDLRNEARVLWSICHPLIRLPVFMDVEGDPSSLVLEYVPGQPLDEVEVTPELSRRTLVQVGMTLRSIHQVGVVHGDLKPSNLILDPNGDVHLIDFGLSRWTRVFHSGSIGVATDVGGTPGYMAPETWERGELSAASDWYGLGAILHEMLTGSPPGFGVRIDASAGELERAVIGLLTRDPRLRWGDRELRPWIGEAPKLEMQRGPDDGANCAILREWLELPGSGVFIVSGAAGVGKSRLIREALVEHEFVAARCYPFETSAFGGLDWLSPVLGLEQQTSSWLSVLREECGSFDAMALHLRDLMTARVDELTVYIEDAGGLEHEAINLLRVVLARATAVRFRLVLEVREVERPALHPLVSIAEAEIAGFSVYHMRLAEERDRRVENAKLTVELGGLSPGARLLLRILALHGHGLRREAADAALTSLMADSALPSVQRLRLLGYISSERGRLYLLRHDIAEYFASESIDDTRRSIHAALLRSTAVHGAPEEQIPHLAALGRTDSARAKAIEVGRLAEHRGAFGEASLWYRRSLEWEPTDEQRTEIKWALASCLEGQGKLQQAAELYSDLGTFEARMSAARCHFDAGEHDRCLDELKVELNHHHLPHRPSRWSIMLALLRGLAWLLTRELRPKAAQRSSEAMRRAELCWLVARGLIMTDAPTSLMMAIQAVRHGLAAGSTLVTGRALAFVGGGVFLQLPLFRRRSQRWIAQIRRWAEEEPVLEPTVELWTGIAAVSRGEWGQSRDRIESARLSIQGRPNMNFERVAAEISELIVLEHQGEYMRLLDIALREWDRARRSGNTLIEIIFSTLAVDGLLAVGQRVPVARALEHAERWLPDRFLPQTFDIVNALAHRDLAQGDIRAAVRRYREMQRPFRRAGGKFAAVTKFRNAKLGGRVGILAGDDGLIREASRDLRNMKRRDTRAFELWFRHVQLGTARVHAREIASALEEGEAYALALAIRLQVDEEESTFESLRSRGISSPRTWARWMAPLERIG